MKWIKVAESGSTVYSKLERIQPNLTSKYTTLRDDNKCKNLTKFNDMLQYLFSNCKTSWKVKKIHLIRMPPTSRYIFSWQLLKVLVHIMNDNTTIKCLTVYICSFSIGRSVDIFSDADHQRTDIETLTCIYNARLYKDDYVSPA